MRTVVWVALACALAAGDALAGEAGGKPAASKAGAPERDPVAEARAHMKTLYEGMWRIERLLAGSQRSAVRSSCVADKLAQARVHVRLGGDEVALVESSAQPEAKAGEATGQAKETKKSDDREDDVRHALTRLELLARRTAEVETAARVCIEDDRSAVDVTRVEVEIAPLPPEPVTAPR